MRKKFFYNSGDLYLARLASRLQIVSFEEFVRISVDSANQALHFPTLTEHIPFQSTMATGTTSGSYGPMSLAIGSYLLMVFFGQLKQIVQQRLYHQMQFSQKLLFYVH